MIAHDGEPVRPIHETAAQMVALRIAVQKNDPDRLSIEPIKLVSKANFLIEQQPRETDESLPYK